MDLSVLSLLARLGKDPWTEAARLAGLPRAAAADSLTAMIERLPADSRPQARARTVALHLVPLLPDRARPGPHTTAAGKSHDGRVVVTLLAGATLSAALGLGLLMAAMVRTLSHASPPNAPTGAMAANRPPPVERASWPSPGGP